MLWGDKAWDRWVLSPPLNKMCYIVFIYYDTQQKIKWYKSLTKFRLWLSHGKTLGTFIIFSMKALLGTDVKARSLTLDGAIMFAMNLVCWYNRGSLELTSHRQRMGKRNVNYAKRAFWFNAEVESNEQILHPTVRKCEIFASKYPLHGNMTGATYNQTNN